MICKRNRKKGPKQKKRGGPDENKKYLSSISQK